MHFVFRRETGYGYYDYVRDFRTMTVTEDVRYAAQISELMMRMVDRQYIETLGFVPVEVGAAGTLFIPDRLFRPDTQGWRPDAMPPAPRKPASFKRYGGNGIPAPVNAARDRRERPHTELREGKPAFRKENGSSGERRSYGNREGSGERKSYGNREGSGERKSYGNREGSGERRSYGNRTYGDRAKEGEKRPYSDSNGSGKRQFGNRNKGHFRNGGNGRPGSKEK